MLKKLLMVTGVIASLMMGGQQASAATIVDTGQPQGSTYYSLSYWQGLAAEFTLTENTVLDSLQMYMRSNSGGNVTVRVYGDAGEVPNQVGYFAQTFAATTVPGWQGVSGANLSLLAGTYWVAFQTDADIGLARDGAPNPLQNYAGFSNNSWFELNASLGVRITSDAASPPAPVPLPAGGLLLISALGGIGVLRRRRSA